MLHFGTKKCTYTRAITVDDTRRRTTAITKVHPRCRYYQEVVLLCDRGRVSFRVGIEKHFTTLPSSKSGDVHSTVDCLEVTSDANVERQVSIKDGTS